jgi:hypothetical protein
MQPSRASLADGPQLLYFVHVVVAVTEVVAGLPLHFISFAYACIQLAWPVYNARQSLITNR